MKSTQSWRRVRKTADSMKKWPIEVAVIEIENKGRLAVTISECSLDLGRMRWWSPGRRTISPRPQFATGSTTDMTVRLEPFDMALYVFDVWQVLAPSYGKASPRPLRLRASVRVAGRRRYRRTSWWKGWRVRREQLAFLSRDVEVGLAAFQVLWRHAYLTGVNPDTKMANCVVAALEVRKRFPPQGEPPTKDDLAQILKATNIQLGEADIELLAFLASKEIRRYFGQPTSRHPLAPPPANR